MRRFLLIALVAVLGAAAVRAQSASSSVRLGAVPEILYAHLPMLKSGQGAVVESVAVGSPAFRAGLRRHDILIQLDGMAIAPTRSGLADLAHLLEDATPRRAQITLLRAGKVMTLALAAETEEPAKGVLKPSGPPAVSVQAQPMGDKLHVTIRYYGEDSSKLRSVTCSGTLAEIESHVRAQARANRMSEEVLDLVDTALSRLRELQPAINSKEK